MARDLSSSDIPIGKPYPLVLRDKEIKSGKTTKGSPWWRVSVGLPRSNPDHNSDYDPEFATLWVRSANLARVLKAHLDRHGTGPVVLVRQDKNEWEVQPEGGAGAGDQKQEDGDRPDRGHTRPPPTSDELWQLALGLVRAYAWFDRQFGALELAQRPTANEIARLAITLGIAASHAGVDLAATFRGAERAAPRGESGPARGNPAPPRPRKPAQPPPPEESPEDEDEDELPF